MPARGLLLGVAVVAFGVLLTVSPALGGDQDGARPARACPGGSLADLGEMKLEELPWDVTIVRANLSARRPMAVAACYLMEDDLLVVSQMGMVYCLSRRDLTPRWVSALKYAIAAVPGEGPSHYNFLVKAPDGQYWVHSFAKRTGLDPDGFPARLPFAASSGVDSGHQMVYVGSLGSPRNNKTVESISLADGKRGWGFRTRGLLWASPVVDPSGVNLILAGEDGTVTSLVASADQPVGPTWTVALDGAVVATPVVTPNHIVVGTQDGILRCLDLSNGETLWLEGLDAPIRTSPWVLGRKEKVLRATGVEGAADIELEAFKGMAFAHNRNGLFAFDVDSGAKLFHDAGARKPVCWNGTHVATLDAGRILHIRDAAADFDETKKLHLSMFDIVPTNTTDGAIFGITHDGGVVAAIPKR